MFVNVIMAVGESKSAMRSAEFHWHKLQCDKHYGSQKIKGVPHQSITLHAAINLKQEHSSL